MAVDVTISEIAGNDLQYIGGLKRAVVTLSVDGDGSTTYPANGIALPSNWWQVKGISTVLNAYLQEPLTTGTAGEAALIGGIDLTNNTLWVLGGASTAAEDVPLEELPTTYTIANLTWTGKLVIEGY